MRANEFANKLKTKVQLGEMATSMCFLKKDGNYTPAVLCVKLEFINNNYAITAIPAMIYWDNYTKTAVREKISFQKQEELNLPIILKEKTESTEDEDTETSSRNINYVTIEKICCALDLDCVTPSMKTVYRKNMGFDDTEGTKIEKMFCYFFPDAMEKLK